MHQLDPERARALGDMALEVVLQCGHVDADDGRFGRRHSEARRSRAARTARLAMAQRCVSDGPS